MRAKLIVNPTAGNGSALEALLEINQALRTELEVVDVALTVGDGDASAAARRAADDGYELVVAAGGDGTLNEVLAGAAAVEGALERTTFGVIPLGTGNDFATALGIPEDVAGAVEVLLAGHTERIDLGYVDERPFINVSGGGFFAEVSDAVPSSLKSFAGKLAYLIGGAQVAFAFEPVRARVLRIADAVFDADGDVPLEALAAGGELHAFAICNAPLVGGGRIIAPHARLDDGRLDVCLMTAGSTVEFLQVLRRVPDGEHVGDERVAYFQASGLELIFDRPIKCNTDGQVFESDRCTYRVAPRAVRLLAPAPPPS